jgi:hypothetical protein
MIPYQQTVILLVLEFILSTDIQVLVFREASPRPNRTNLVVSEAPNGYEKTLT